MPRDILNNLAALRIVERADEDYIPLEETSKSKYNHQKLPNQSPEPEDSQDNCYYNYGINDGSGRYHESYLHYKSCSLPAGAGVGAGAQAQDAVLRSALRIAPEDIANQVTLLDLACFKAIRADELATCGWTKANKLAVAPNVVAFTQRFNRVSFWTVQEILNGETPKSRAEIMAHFIKVAKKLHELNNIHSLFAVISALQSASIYRLSKTWACLGKKDKQVFDKLAELFLDHDNWAALRTYIKSLQLPCIPYLGMYLTDLVYLDMAHPAGSPHRASRMDVVLRALLGFQASEYPQAPLPRVTRYLSSVRYIEELQKFVEDDQFKLSQRLEPQSAGTSRSGSKESVKDSGTATPFSLSPSHPHRSAHGSFRLSAAAVTPAAKFHPTHRKCRSLGTNIFSACGAESCEEEGMGPGGVNLLDDTLLEAGAAPGAARPLHRGSSSDLEPTSAGYQGLLKRKTIIKAGRKPALSSWQRYWVQIWTSSLIYFSPKSFKSSSRSGFRSEPCKVMPLTGWSALRVDGAPPDTFQLVDTFNSTLYKFKTESVDSAKEWVSQITEASSQTVKPLPDNLLSFE